MTTDLPPAGLSWAAYIARWVDDCGGWLPLADQVIARARRRDGPRPPGICRGPPARFRRAPRGWSRRRPRLPGARRDPARRALHAAAGGRRARPRRCAPALRADPRVVDSVRRVLARHRP